MRSALLLLGLTIAGAASGCADNTVSLTILNFEAITSSSNCVAMSTATDIITHGVLDVTLATGQGYVAFPIVRNNQMPRNAFSGAPEYNIVQVKGFDVELQLPDELASMVSSKDLKFFYGGSAALDPQLTQVFNVELMPLKVSQQLIGKLSGTTHVITAKVKAVGDQNGDTVVGGDAYFPIDVCQGCLVEGAGSSCPLPANTTVGTGGCIIGQDQVLTCCKDAASGSELCGAQAPVAAPAMM